MRIPVSVHLPPDLHATAKALADKRHTSLGAIARQALQEHVDGHQGIDAGLGNTEETIGRIETALERVLVAVVRIGDRLQSVNDGR